jgi:serine/threonine protein kinase
MERLRDVAGVLNLAQQETNPSLFKNKVFKFIEVLNLSRDLAIALRYLHSHVHSNAMILHRDLKPENLGLSAEGKLKLFDFGLCRCVLKRSADSELYEMTGNTGSLRYMAPEVVLGKPYSEKVDVYSFAMIMWTFAKSKSPFKGFDRVMHRARVVDNGERPKIDPDWPEDFSSLLESCWHADTGVRPSFTTISANLEEMIENYNRNPSAVKGKKNGMAFLKTMFMKR